MQKRLQLVERERLTCRVRPSGLSLLRAETPNSMLTCPIALLFGAGQSRKVGKWTFLNSIDHSAVVSAVPEMSSGNSIFEVTRVRRQTQKFRNVHFRELTPRLTARGTTQRGIVQKCPLAGNRPRALRGGPTVGRPTGSLAFPLTSLPPKVLERMFGK